MAITKTKEEIYEWFTTKNWFKSYEKQLFYQPVSRNVASSNCTNFKDYLNYAYHRLNRGNQSYIEFLLLDFRTDRSVEGDYYWRQLDDIYWNKYVRF